jgi:epoxyqueuosine reductase QueG
MNKNLSKLIHNVGDYIIASGYNCKIVEPSDENEIKNENYQRILRTSISHKMVATRAGLGWIGKTDLFISKKFGPRLRLVSLLTDYPLDQTGKAINNRRCGKCIECISACPAKAGNGQLWDIHTDRDVFFDAYKCRAKCVELSKKYLNSNSATCGICVSVCPIGMRK